MTTFKLTLISICLLSPLLLLTSGHGDVKTSSTKSNIPTHHSNKDHLKKGDLSDLQVCGNIQIPVRVASIAYLDDIDTPFTDKQKYEIAKREIANKDQAILTLRRKIKMMEEEKEGKEFNLSEMQKNAIKLTARQAHLTLNKEHKFVERIKEALNEQTEIDFIDTPIEDVVEYLAEFHSITINIDDRGYLNGEIDIDEPVNKTLSGVTLESALNQIFEPLDFDFIIKDEVLMITTKELAKKQKEIIIYKLEGIQETPKEFCEIIEKMIDPGSWNDKTDKKRDPSAASIEPLKDGMVIRKTQRNHRKIVSNRSRLKIGRALC